MNTKRYKIILSDEERDIVSKIVAENIEDSKLSYELNSSFI